MIQILHRLGQLLGNVLSEDQERRFRISRAEHVLRYYWAGAALVLGLQIFNIIHVLAYTGGAVHTTASQVYFCLYVILTAVTAAILWLAFRLRRSMPESAERVYRLQLVYECFLVAWQTTVTIYDQRTSDNVGGYLVIALIIAMVIYIRPLSALLLYGLAQTVLMLGIPLFRADGTENLYSAYFHLFMVNLMAFLMVCYRYHYERVTFRDRERILQQNEDIRSSNRMLSRLVRHDALTGTFNRRFLGEELPRICEKCAASGSPLAFLMLDVDDFKKYNDQFGHLAGDACLQQAAQALNALMGEGEYLIRYGGEEFLFVAENMGREALQARAGELQQTILDLHLKNPVEGKGPWLTVSMGGFSDLPTGASSWESMLSRADDALYLAKSQGKNCLVCAWDEPSEEKSAL